MTHDKQPAPGVRDIVRETRDFCEAVRLHFINDLDEPNRTVFWKAVGLQKRADAIIAAFPNLAPSANDGWRDIASAPKDGTYVDLWVRERRVADCYFGRPEHSCGEYGNYCDSCPGHDGWCDVFGYVEDGATHWKTFPAMRSEQSDSFNPIPASQAREQRRQAALFDEISFALNEGNLTNDEMIAQGNRCSCKGSDDYCPCQNRADDQTLQERRASNDQR